ncbi:MAG: GNAT family N-acetyltransferase [Emticicia sp.]
MIIKEITTLTPATQTAVQHFIDLLVNIPYTAPTETLTALVASENSHLFLAFDEAENIVGMLTVGMYYSPTGKKAWIEDVVVDDIYRGQGIGEQLVQHAIEFVKTKQVNLLMLTSHPSRIAANKLYPRVGFNKRETNVYKMPIE